MCSPRDSASLLGESGAQLPQTQGVEPTIPAGSRCSSPSCEVAVDLDLQREAIEHTANRRLGVSVQFINVTYKVNVTYSAHWWSRGKKEEKSILHDINGHVQAGEMLAIMGPSGSGKTTLMKLLGGRLERPADAQILFGGRQRDRNTRRKIAFVTQEDLFFSNLTVEEVLRFTAAVRLPEQLGDEERRNRVAQTISLLRLEKASQTLVGDGLVRTGISGGECKRLSIANELLMEPSVILLDEPTSGLDSTTAMSVIRLLRELAAAGNTVITTIHQPSSPIFAKFDKLLLISGGRTAYFGDARQAYDYFSGLGYRCPAEDNFADYFLQIVSDSTPDSDGVSSRERIEAAWEMEQPARAEIPAQAQPTTKARKRWLTRAVSRGASSVQAFVPGLSANKPADAAVEEGTEKGTAARDVDGETTFFEKDGRRYATSWWTQFVQLSWRAFKQKRGNVLEPWPITQVIITAIFVSTIWFHTPMTEGSLQDLVGNLFFTVAFWGFLPCLGATSAFPSEKAVIRKERASGSYYLSAYFMAKSTTEIPLDVLYPFFFGIAVYWATALPANASVFFTYMTVLLTHVLIAQSVGLAVSAATMNMKKATVLSSVIALTCMMVGGYYKNGNNLPSWVSWLRYVSYFYYAYTAIVADVFRGEALPCNAATPTLYRTGGCPITSSSICSALDLRCELGVWGNYGVMLVFLVLLRALAYTFLRVLHVQHKRA